MRTALALALALAATSLLIACQSEPAVAPTEQPRATTRPNPSAVMPADRELIRSFVAFARSPTDSAWRKLGLARNVRLGLGRRLLLKRSARELRDPDAWEINTHTFFRGGVGPFSALRLLSRQPGALRVAVGPHAHCVSRPVSPPQVVGSLRRVSVQPRNPESCLSWWTVDVYVSDDGEVRAVTLDHWEP